MTSSSIDFKSTKKFNFRVVLCRIRLFPTSISKIKWLWSEPSLKTYLQHISFWFANQWNWFSFCSSSGCTTNTMNIWFVIIWQCHIYNSSNWWNIQTTSSYIRTNKNITFAIFEIGFSRISKSKAAQKDIKLPTRIHPEGAKRVVITDNFVSLRRHKWF